MRIVDELETEHAELMVLARALSCQVKRGTPPPIVPLFELRTKLASVLLRHLKSEDWVLYPKMMESEHPEARSTASRLQEQMGSLADAFKLHMECWTAFAIENDWTAYRAEAMTLLEALDRRITLEEAQLYPLAREVGSTEAMSRSG